MPNELILIVEDVDLLRDGLHEILSGEGYEVVTARNGQDALHKMNVQLPDLIVSDITMPVMDGYDFYSAVRSRPEWVTIPFIFLSARSGTADFLTGRYLGVDDYLTKPISREELVTTVHSRLGRFHQAQTARIHQAYLDSLVALANAIETRASSASRHVERISEYTVVLAEKLGWQGKRLTELKFAAILHDIGKIHIPASILFKPGALTDAEWEIVRRHPVTGAEMIKDVPFLTECVPIVRHHHERWDGSGYPDRLKGAAIPEGARILAIADSLDAMITPRPYAPAISLEAACAEIVDQTSVKYDPDLAALFQEAYRSGQLQAILAKMPVSGPGAQAAQEAV